ncbi:MAG: cytochrome c oxidase subunit 3 family protein [Chloroflexi bacterium]|nr:MAG: cytochrome c oxidase subunit 3 family protein [Chloroflexota bacterium]
MAKSHAVRAPLAHQFDTLEQQHSTNVLGMWIFLLTEIMLFGGLFLMYTTNRYLYARVFEEGSRHLDLALGSVNTVVLIVSSLMMALAVHSVQSGAPRVRTALFLALTAALGAMFLVIKGFEYYGHYLAHEVPGITFAWTGENARQMQIFFMLYSFMTGTHAVHLFIGISIVTLMLFNSLRGKYNELYYAPVEMTGLYWHLVDAIWIFLFPLLYLIARR